ncbi:polysaccharide deacetylase family protein [Salegentibacter salegens]|uniref:Peptidoglycan/xylan/chitin deacetylase, PgdA/CDA1 family n=1 Tax=Salegentibacter salegens TaxID=143223 RepID=A0A1M7J280_9FLAO|nr:polysaccharide deacetylase family protein [Salegentibacter salegens]PRX47390.1 peptidoglycan/xylan/chitin deacetylase (PgdA/CDA1 family) [Salegentibacter salegens]SHM47048.1 Peptidoglycan/xylan/chitin deacetylase, PgdA/CDA1 family [Salegentibacter salegens]
MRFKIINTVIILLLFAGLVLAIFGFTSFWYVLSFIVFYLLFLLTVSTNVRFNFFVNSISENPGIKEKQIAISFDDGPVENTLEILKVLEKYNAKAGFFCIGKNIKKNPEIFRKILTKGHLVGNHTYSHTRKMGALSVSTIVKEIEDCNKIAEETAGIKMKLFRPPFGIVSPKTKKALQKIDMLSIGWSIRSFDAVLSSEEIILNRIKKRLKPGAVILLHDNNAKTVNILEQLLLFLKNNQYEVVRPDKLLEINAYS